MAVLKWFITGLPQTKLKVIKMGRWLKKLESMPKTELTKPTEQPCVSFVSTHSGHFQKTLWEFVKACIGDKVVAPQLVIDHLLSTEDEQDIIAGKITPETLSRFIVVWLENGMPHYSDKPHSKEGVIT